MHPDHAEVVAIGLQIDELLLRVTTLADRHRDADEHDISTDLDEAERTLRNASRRVAKLQRSLR